MSSLGHPALQQLHRLDRSSSGFHDQLSSVLYGEEYQKCVQNLQCDDLVWLVEYLDKVRRRAAFPALRLSYSRLSMVSRSPVPVSGSVCANSGVYAVHGRCSRHRTHFRLPI